MDLPLSYLNFTLLDSLIYILFPIIISCLIVDPFSICIFDPKHCPFYAFLFLFFSQLHSFLPPAKADMRPTSIAFFSLVHQQPTHTTPTLINSAVSNSFTRPTLPSLLGHFPFYFYPRHRRIIVRSSPFLLLHDGSRSYGLVLNLSLSLSVTFLLFLLMRCLPLFFFFLQSGSKLPFLGVCIDVVTPPVSPTSVSQLGTRFFCSNAAK